MKEKENPYANARDDAIKKRVRDMYNLYGEIRRILFEGSKPERVRMLSELIRMQGGQDRGFLNGRNARRPNETCS